MRALVKETQHLKRSPESQGGGLGGGFGDGLSIQKSFSHRSADSDKPKGMTVIQSTGEFSQQGTFVSVIYLF